MQRRSRRVLPNTMSIIQMLCVYVGRASLLMVIVADLQYVVADGCCQTKIKTRAKLLRDEPRAQQNIHGQVLLEPKFEGNPFYT